ncbi:SMP-30/gluconolactonase/LRE family protein [Diaphorobacter sp. HDW4A]|uniref:SMP-30/gluconolactonase/LRE family protein n=1 Tax=Diaphorobacter sp. HDW4A TaxID=2714924 RepID=UPI00140C2EE7|nr:SMP-30/gluconolactonase/LRE family protein [Diaphorobacter sp. HDW4A]QIL80014.1 SMP-30/gluconolactonase/LRE family protein [Diaphorobacter sp. HDW4A]
MKRNAYSVRVVPNVHNLLGECPMWHPVEQRLYWIDTRLPAVMRQEEDGSVSQWPMPVNIGSYVFREQGGLIAGLQTGFSEIALDDFSVAPRVNPEPHKPLNRLNDGRCDRRGRYWAGTRDPGNDCASGSLYCLTSDFEVSKKDEGFIVPNGLAFSPDDQSLVFGCTRGDTIYRYDFDLPSGDIGNRRIFIDTSGTPWRVDGATFDSEGFYWAALIGGGAIGRFDANGRLDRFIPLPYQYPTMCNFGGKDLDVLYVTTGTFFVDEDGRRRQPLAGCMFAIHGLGVQGVPEPIFPG